MSESTRVMLTMVTDESPYRPGPREPFGIFVGRTQLAEARPAKTGDGWQVFTRNALGDYMVLDAEADSRIGAIATQTDYAEETVACELAYLRSAHAYRADRLTRGLAH
jgi:hypothetical protein